MAVEAERAAQAGGLDPLKPMPIMHLAQLIGVAAGLEDSELKFRRHVVSMKPVLDKLAV